MNRIIFLSLGALLLASGNLFSYGPIGHEIVGGIADELLAKKPTGAKVSALLDGIRLEKAAVIADEIKGWDKRGVDDPNIFHYRNHPKIDNQLCGFWRANQPTHDPNSLTPSHHWFHYTDVPVSNAQKYSDGKAGRTPWDVVHMITYCVAVLRGEIPEDNARKITKPIAIILLAHFVGDIHQPLHVGAEYFDQAGHVVDPDKEKANLEDEGGNTLTLQLLANESADAPHAKNLHAFWDGDAVNALLPQLAPEMEKEERHHKNEDARKQLIHDMAIHEPKNWQLDRKIDIKNYAEAWANEILPKAREAHERLQLSGIHPQQEEDRTVAAGIAAEKPAPDHVAYRDWASHLVREELHKAGWRLADLLEKALP